MGSWWSSGIKVSVVNKTTYTWYFATQDRGYKRIGPNSTESYKEARTDAHIRIRYEKHSKDSFSCRFNTQNSGTSLILIEITKNHKIQMHCTSMEEDHFCPIPAD